MIPAVTRRFLLLLLVAGVTTSVPTAQAPPPFEVHEATIAQIHDAMKAGRLTCKALVEQYLQRIDVYDKNGPAINAIVITNPEAREAGRGRSTAATRRAGRSARCTASRRS